MKKQILLGLGIIIFIFLAVGSTSSNKKEKKMENKEEVEQKVEITSEEKEKLWKEAVEEINQGNFESAKEKLNKIETKDSEDLIKEINFAINTNTQRMKLQELTDSEFKELKSGKLEKRYLQSDNLNNYFISQMKEIKDSDEIRNKKVSSTSKQEIEYEEDEIAKELRSKIGTRTKKITVFDDGAIVQVEAQDGINRKMIVKGMVRDSSQILEELEKISKKHGANSYKEVTIEFFFDLKSPDGKVSNEKIFRITKSGSDIKPTLIHPVIQQAYSELYE